MRTQPGREGVGWPWALPYLPPPRRGDGSVRRQHHSDCPEHSFLSVDQSLWVMPRLPPTTLPQGVNFPEGLGTRWPSEAGRRSLGRFRKLLFKFGKMQLTGCRGTRPSWLVFGGPAVLVKLGCGLWNEGTKSGAVFHTHQTGLTQCEGVRVGGT